MNVLILTPDAVGSTLLQRLITIYMNFHRFDKPVINTHELTNGLVKFYSSDFNQEIIGKPTNNLEWTYFQSLREIQEMLTGADHYKVCRLAQYHIRNRHDSIEQQIPFYRYLDENFYIIACRRHNLFEHAISWALNKVTKKLNVYSAQEKINTFYDFYQDPIDIDITSLEHSLDSYWNYLIWADDYFSVGRYFYYDQDLNDIERFVLGLPMFSGQSRITWNDTYGMEFNDWNKCHYFASDIGSLALEDRSKFLSLTSQDIPTTDHQTSLITVGQNLWSALPAERRAFLETNTKKFKDAIDSIEQMNRLGILVGGLPIKKQTLAQKMLMVSNLDACIDAYNRWIDRHPELGTTIDRVWLDQRCQQEEKSWKIDPPDAVNQSMVRSLQLPTGQS